MSFKDHFSPVSKDYAQYRPGYPPELFQSILQHVKQKDTAWDCATGSGQAAVELAPHFKQVIATDASAQQLASAVDHPRVKYQVALAEDCQLESNTIDLVTVAQALHWFDFDKFYPEVFRVAKPEAVFAAWSYGLFSFEHDPLDQHVRTFYHDIIGPYWPPERIYTDKGYATIPVPFENLPSEIHFMQISYTVDHIINYLSTWSAVKNYRQALKQDPIPELRERLQDAWPQSDSLIATTPIYLRMAIIRK